MSVATAVTASSPLVKVEVGDPLDRILRNGVGKSSDQGVRYVTHRLISGDRFAVLSGGH